MSEEPIDGNDHELMAAYLYGCADTNEIIRKQQQEIERLQSENRQLMEQLSDKAYHEGRYITLQEFMEHRKQQAADPVSTGLPAINGNDHELTAAYLCGRADANEIIRKQQQEIERLQSEIDKEKTDGREQAGVARVVSNDGPVAKVARSR